ncbi:MAG: hypothetical protein KF774_09750 [Planctomyces sp.]|nr:hypothetical protein [Planctomyces sp.]
MLMVGAAAATADEREALRDKLQAIQQEVAELAKQGRLDAAAEVKQKAAGLMDEIARLEKEEGAKIKEAAQGEAAKLKARLKELAVQEKKLASESGHEREMEEIRALQAKIEKELSGNVYSSAAIGKIERDQLEFRHKLERGGKRVENMRIAARHLKEAEMHDLAVMIDEQAARQDKELREAYEQVQAEMRKRKEQQVKKAEHETSEVEALRKENAALRAELEKLRERKEGI